jgi:hypothetical protein
MDEGDLLMLIECEHKEFILIFWNMVWGRLLPEAYEFTHDKKNTNSF